MYNIHVYLYFVLRSCTGSGEFYFCKNTLFHYVYSCTLIPVAQHRDEIRGHGGRRDHDVDRHGSGRSSNRFPLTGRRHRQCYPPICRKHCREYVYDRWGCKTCECKPHYCRKVHCRLYCPHGYKKDYHGCDKCECATYQCPHRYCHLRHCPYGRKKDRYGCETCECDSYHCPAHHCARHCPHGYKKDRHGCDSCECSKL